MIELKSHLVTIASQFLIGCGEFGFELPTLLSFLTRDRIVCGRRSWGRTRFADGS